MQAGRHSLTDGASAAAGCNNMPGNCRLSQQPDQANQGVRLPGGQGRFNDLIASIF